MALRFELTGGFIKNAILSALSIAVSRDGETPVVCQKDLLQGANLQLRGRLRMKVVREGGGGRRGEEGGRGGGEERERGRGGEGDGGREREGERERES